MIYNTHVWKLQKNNNEATIHQTSQKPSKIKIINICLCQKQIQLLKKWKTRFRDHPNYLPECFPTLQGPLKTPQTSRGPHKITPGPPGDAPKIPPGPPKIVPASPQHPQGPCTELPELPRSISRIPEALSLLPPSLKWPRRNREAYTIQPLPQGAPPLSAWQRVVQRPAFL